MSQHDHAWKHKPIDNPIRARLNRWLFDLSSPTGRRTNQMLMLVIIFSVVVGMIGTVEHIGQAWQERFYILEYGITLIFVAEYILRLYAARNPMAYARVSMA